MDNTGRIAYELLSAGFGRPLSSPSAEEISKAREDLQTKFQAYDELLERAAILDATNNHLKRALEERDQELAGIKGRLTWIKWGDERIIDSIQNRIKESDSLIFPALERFAEVKRTNEAKRAGRIKRTDKDKQLIKQCWQEWMDGKISYSGKSDFARKMARLNLSVKCNRETVSRWIAEWECEKKK